MMDMGSVGGEGRRRGSNGHKKTWGKTNQHQSYHKMQNQKRRMHKARPGDASIQLTFPQEHISQDFANDANSVLGGRRPKTLDKRHLPTDKGPPNAFTLFSAYYLGLMPDEVYAHPTLEEVARRFGMPPQEVQDLLKQLGLDEETVRGSKFDIKGAHLDIRVAPVGISRREIAQDHYQDFIAARKATGLADRL